MPRLGRRVAVLAGVAVVILLAAGVAGLMVGSPTLGAEQVWEAFGASAGDLVRITVVESRLPRWVLGALAGGALALAGALLQDVLRNPIAAPDLLGVSGGCAVVIASAAVLGLGIPRALLSSAATLGGLAIGAAVLAVGLRARSASGLSMILVGLACSTFLTGCVIAIITLGAPSNVGLFYSYLLGSLVNRGWADVQLVAPWVAIALPGALLIAPRLNALRLGDEVATSIGIGVAGTRRAVFALACALTAAVVATCGPIGFVSLIAPHLVRRILRTEDARLVLPLCVLVGAAVLVSADVLGRALVAPREIAVGVWTVLVGAPILLWLLRARDRAAA